MSEFMTWLEGSWLAALSLNNSWFFPMLEVLHFLGLSLLIGSIGLMDLRLLGFARALSVAALNRLLPWAFVGFGINLLSGALMFASNPGMYYPNIAFRVKMLLVLVAGINTLLFRFTVQHTDGELGANQPASVPAKLMAACSLTLWIAVILGGRLMPSFGAGG